jgi:hypothetical protein
MLLLVDNRDGRVLTALESPEEGLRLLEAMATSKLPDYLCIVRFDDRQGEILGTESSLRVRPLQR